MSVAGVIAQITLSVRVGGASVCGLVTGITFVDCRFFRSWSKWPFTVCLLFGKCFLTNFVVRPGNEETNPLSIASSRVDFTGNPREAWWNLARSRFVVSDRIMALQFGVTSVIGRSASNCTNHMVLGPRQCLTIITTPSLLRMRSFFSEKVAVQPWSHSCPMDNSPVVVICGNKCWMHASCGRDGMSSMRVWVDDMVLPFGNNTLIDFFTFLLCCLMPS